MLKSMRFLLTLGNLNPLAVFLPKLIRETFPVWYATNGGFCINCVLFVLFGGESMHNTSKLQRLMTTFYPFYISYKQVDTA